MTFKRQKLVFTKSSSLLAEAETVDGVSYFLERLENCLRTIPALEWNTRRKQKKKEKLLARQTLQPATLMKGEEFKKH